MCRYSRSLTFKVVTCMLLMLCLFGFFSAGKVAPRQRAFGVNAVLSDAMITRTVTNTKVPDNETIDYQFRDKFIETRRSTSKILGHHYSAKYDNAWTKHGYPQGSCFGCRFYKDLVKYLDFETVFDAGAGNGMGIRMMRALGKTAHGLELSQSVIDQDSQDLVSMGVIQQGSLVDIPFESNTFDLITSGDVLEHIEEGMEADVVRELVRVSKRYIVVSISLKSHQNENLHTYLRSREWWETLFESYGVKVLKRLRYDLQDTVHQIYPPITRSSLSDCRVEGSISQGGQYECCLVKKTWLVGLGIPRLQRAVTTSNGELEPWIFAFEKL